MRPQAADELAHVLGRVLVADHGAGEGVDHHEGDRLAGLLADAAGSGRSPLGVAVQQVDGGAVTTAPAGARPLVALPGPDAALDDSRALGRDVDHDALLDVHAAPGHAGGDVAGEVEATKVLPLPLSP